MDVIAHENFLTAKYFQTTVATLSAQWFVPIYTYALLADWAVCKQIAPCLLNHVHTSTEVYAMCVMTTDSKNLNGFKCIAIALYSTYSI